ncbi:extracellular solute-binding protein [Photobacterium sp. ZSDE20]|uniref:Extracellular solute-binding protein n=1 Tax=Photobacterium pectinilyticum TaxID=2906793 RepID=A0ABT1MVY6_9GAMM|nr:extracellular solute-binding protein [Photobacterium sp. ZSDE20]MCQ1056635.1 extracellular solute-binding protein [Photobacterium sp. ZSDE20]MDD1820770.1 extracellular solute-binding protein [Photobacterium sp. ZSDE20]
MARTKFTFAALMAFASTHVLADSLIIYSPQAAGARGDFIAKEAYRALGIDLRYLSGGGGELHDRLVAERNNRQADVVMGLTQTGMYSLKQHGLLDQYTPSWEEGLPEAYKDKDGYFHMFWQTPVVMAYNSEHMTEEQAPKSWLDLVNPEYADKFSIGNLSAQTTRVYLSGMIHQFKTEEGQIDDKAWDYMRDLFDNVNPMSEGTEYWRHVATGETPIVLNWLGGVMSNANSNRIKMNYVNPIEGTPIVAEGIGIVKGTDNIETAQRFIDWFGSPEFMAKYANRFNQTPAHPEAIKRSNRNIQKYANMFDVQNIDWEFVTEHQNTWLENIQLDVL